MIKYDASELCPSCSYTPQIQSPFLFQNEADFLLRDFYFFKIFNCMPVSKINQIFLLKILRGIYISKRGGWVVKSAATLHIPKLLKERLYKSYQNDCAFEAQRLKFRLNPLLTECTLNQRYSNFACFICGMHLLRRNS